MDLKITTGLVEHNLEGINGSFPVLFNPTDGGFAEDLVTAIEKLDALENKYSDLIRNEEDGAKVFQLGRDKDVEQRAILDGLLGDGCCDTVYGKIRVYAGDGDGFPLWFSLLTMLLDNMSDAFEKEKAATNPRLEKYVNKYKRK